MKHVLGLLALLVLVAACKKKETQAEKDERIIKEYIEANNLNASATGSGL